MPDPAPENLKRLAALAAELGGHIQLGESLLGSERSIAALLSQGERALIATQLGDLDVVQGLNGVPSYAELRARAIDVDLAGVTIAICALQDLREASCVAASACRPKRRPLMPSARRLQPGESGSLTSRPLCAGHVLAPRTRQSLCPPILEDRVDLDLFFVGLDHREFQTRLFEGCFVERGFQDVLRCSYEAFRFLSTFRV